uniref:Zinc finger LSD1-type domain-containing protein n=1 Tax=Oryza meridionalis TaxID=40149 RepID=A0A0E0C4L6_9ORYZ
MASSPETAKPLESARMGSPPPSHSPSPPPLQGDPSLPTDAPPPEPSPQPHHATPIPPPSPGQATEGWPRAEEPQPPIDGTPGAAGPPAPPSFFPSLELGTSAAPPALEAAAAGAGQPGSPSPRPPAEPAAEFYPGSAASSPSSSSYETAEDDSPASPPPTPPPLVLCASPDSSYTESSPARDRFGDEEGSHAAPEPPPPPTPLEGGPDASSAEPAAMASPAREPMGSHTAPEPPTPPLESGQEGFQQQQPHPQPTTHPECDSSEPAEPLLPPTSPAEIAHTSPDSAEVDVVAVSPEEAPGSTAAMEVMYGETDASAVSVSPVLGSVETDAAEIDVIAGMQEEAPGSTVAMEVMYRENDTAAVSVSPVLESREPDAAEVDVVAGVQEEAHGSKFSMEVTYRETDAAAVSVSPVLGSGEPDKAEIDVVEEMQEEAHASRFAMEAMYEEPDASAVSVSPVLESVEPDVTEIDVVSEMQEEEAPDSTLAMEVTSGETDTAAVSAFPVLDGGDPDAAEKNVVAGMQEEEAPDSTLAIEVTSGETDTAAVSVSPVLEGVDPDAAEIDVVAGMQEEAPGSTLAMEVTYRETDATAASVSTVLDSRDPDAAEVDVVVGMQEQAAGSALAMLVTYGETDTSAVSVSPVLESGEPDAAQIDVVAGMQEEAPGSTLAMEVTYREVDAATVSVSLVLESVEPDAAKIDVVARIQEEAPGSKLAMEVMYGETGTAAVSVPLVLESGEEGSLQESMQRPSSPTMNIEQESMQRPFSPTIGIETSSPEMAPAGSENCKVSWLPLPPPTPLGESMPSLPVAAAPKVLLVMPEEAVESVPSSEALDAEKPASITQAEPSSPNTPPPGFENFKSSWLPLPTTPPPVETTDVLPDVVVTKAMEAPIEEVSRPLPALEVTNMESDTVLSILPTTVLPTEGTEGLLQQPLLRPPSPVVQSEPCLQNEMAPPGFENFKSSCSAEEIAPPGSDNFKSSSEPCSPEEMAPPGFENFKSSSEPCSQEEMAPPGFENFKSSWPPLPTLPQTVPDAAAADALAATVEEAAGPPPALELEAMDVDMDAIHPPPLPFDSGVESSQKPLPRAPSPIMQEAPCSPDRAPPGFETYKSSQLLLPSPSLAQTTNVRQDQSVTEPVSVIEEAPQPLHSVEVMGAHMDAVPPLLPSFESGEDGLSPQQFAQPPPAEKDTTTCLPDMVHSGCDNSEPSQLLSLPAVISPVQTPDGLADVPAIDRVAMALEESPQRPLVSGEMEAGTVPIQSSPLKNVSEGSLPQLESESHSPTSQAADSLLDASDSKSVAVASEEMSQLPLASQATTTDLDSTTAMQPQSEGIVDESLQPQHPPSSTAHDSPCLQNSVPLVPPPPSPYLNKAHEVGKVHCGHCATLLMYPFGAPAVKCSLCLFVTEIGERNVRRRLSIEQPTRTNSSGLAEA